MASFYLFLPFFNRRIKRWIWLHICIALHCSCLKGKVSSNTKPLKQTVMVNRKSNLKVQIFRILEGPNPSISYECDILAYFQFLRIHFGTNRKLLKNGIRSPTKPTDFKLSYKITWKCLFHCPWLGDTLHHNWILAWSTNPNQVKHFQNSKI